MSEEIIKVLDYITEKLGVAIDWSTENALPYIEEILGKYATYNIVKHSIAVTVGLLAILALFGFFGVLGRSKKKCKQTQKNTFWYAIYPSGKAVFDEDLFGFALTISVVLGIIGSVLMINSTGDLIKWSFIPEIAMLEEIQTLIG